MTAVPDARPSDSGPSDRRSVHGTRTRGRELALKYLYGADLTGRGSLEDFEAFAVHQDARGLAVDFARRLVTGVLDRRAAIDAVLRGLAVNWSLERMGVVDRNILRLACFEIQCEADTPVRVAINEAVDLAKKFGTAQSGAFVNGILDRVPRPGAGDDRTERE